ncbi:hypothetical protein ABVK25_009405 [Lepraria finkii]|uniref:Uncharacterized protein n=1 Tax=Lepraria finkii TaxID=1340010 RepID=A0ABR4AZC2_9LECA
MDYLRASAALGDTPLPWNSCKLAASPVRSLAAPKTQKPCIQALKFQSITLGDLPTMAMINSTPSADLTARFVRAKKAALDGKVGKVTVLAVSLVDVEMIERGESGKKPMDYSSFAHSYSRSRYCSRRMAHFSGVGGSTNICLMNISTVVGHG